MAEDPIALRANAQNARKNKDYLNACALYSSLLELEADEEPMTLLVCRDHIHYAECLLYSQSNEINDEDLEIAWETLEKARYGYESMADSVDKFSGLIDVHDIQGEITLKNMNYSEAEHQFDESAIIGLAHPKVSWRLPVNSLFCKSTAQKFMGKFQNATNTLTQAIDLINRASLATSDPQEKETMKLFIEDLESAKSAIPQ